MILPIIVTLLLSLAVTEAVELLVSLLLRVKKEDLPVVFLVNLITNPPYVLLVSICRYFLQASVLIPMMVVCEIVIFLVEALLFRKYLKDAEHPFWLSAAANLASIAAGAGLSLLL